MGCNFDGMARFAASSHTVKRDDDNSRAAFALMLAENDRWLSDVHTQQGVQQTHDHSACSSSTALGGNDDNLLRVEAGNVSMIQHKTSDSTLQEPVADEPDTIYPNNAGESQDVHTQKEQSTVKIYQIIKQLDALRFENQQLSECQSTTTNLMDRIDRLYIEKDNDKDRIRNMSEVRIRLIDQLHRKEDMDKKQRKEVLDYTNKVTLLELELSRMKIALEAQNNKHVAEIKTIKSDMASVSSQKAAQFDLLNNVRKELRNSLNANESLRNEIAALKSQIPAPPHDKQQTWQAHRNLAYYVTQLDLADYGYRFFTCEHTSLSKIPDGKSTRQKNISIIADEIFRDYYNSEHFTNKYCAHRQYIIEHHRAHERKDPGRGDFAAKIKNTFTNIDSCRGMYQNYN